MASQLIIGAFPPPTRPLIARSHAMNISMVQSLFAAALLAGPASTPAGPAPVTVVAIRYDLDEVSAERIEEVVIGPLERSLRDVPRMKSLHTTASHRIATAELSLEGDAADADLADVIYRLDRLRLDAGIVIEGRSVTLTPCRLSCEDDSSSP
jgi:vancomycin resistance protein YoaR